MQYNKWRASVKEMQDDSRTQNTGRESVRSRKKQRTKPADLPLAPVKPQFPDDPRKTPEFAEAIRGKFVHFLKDFFFRYSLNAKREHPKEKEITEPNVVSKPFTVVVVGLRNYATTPQVMMKEIFNAVKTLLSATNMSTLIHSRLIALSPDPVVSRSNYLSHLLEMKDSLIETLESIKIGDSSKFKEQLLDSPFFQGLLKTQNGGYIDEYFLSRFSKAKLSQIKTDIFSQRSQVFDLEKRLETIEKEIKIEQLLLKQEQDALEKYKSSLADEKEIPEEQPQPKNVSRVGNSRSRGKLKRVKSQLSGPEPSPINTKPTLSSFLKTVLKGDEAIRFSYRPQTITSDNLGNTYRALVNSWSSLCKQCQEFGVETASIGNAEKTEELSTIQDSKDGSSRERPLKGMSKTPSKRSKIMSESHDVPEYLPDGSQFYSIVSLRDTTELLNAFLELPGYEEKIHDVTSKKDTNVNRAEYCSIFYSLLSMYRTLESRQPTVSKKGTRAEHSEQTHQSTRKLLPSSRPNLGSRPLLSRARQTESKSEKQVGPLPNITILRKIPSVLSLPIAEMTLQEEPQMAHKGRPKKTKSRLPSPRMPLQEDPEHPMEEEEEEDYPQEWTIPPHSSIPVFFRFNHEKPIEISHDFVFTSPAFPSSFDLRLSVNACTDYPKINNEPFSLVPKAFPSKLLLPGMTKMLMPVQKKEEPPDPSTNAESFSDVPQSPLKGGKANAPTPDTKRPGTKGKRKQATPMTPQEFVQPEITIDSYIDAIGQPSKQTILFPPIRSNIEQPMPLAEPTIDLLEAIKQAIERERFENDPKNAKRNPKGKKGSPGANTRRSTKSDIPKKDDEESPEEKEFIPPTLKDIIASLKTPLSREAEEEDGETVVKKTNVLRVYKELSNAHKSHCCVVKLQNTGIFPCFISLHIESLKQLLQSEKTDSSQKSRSRSSKSRRKSASALVTEGAQEENQNTSVWDLTDMETQMRLIQTAGEFYSDRADPSKPKNAFYITPPLLVLQPGEVGHAILSCYPCDIGPIQDSLIIQIQDNPQNIKFDLRSFGAQPDIELTLPECPPELVPSLSEMVQHSPFVVDPLFLHPPGAPPPDDPSSSKSKKVGKKPTKDSLKIEEPPSFTSLLIPRMPIGRSNSLAFEIENTSLLPIMWEFIPIEEDLLKNITQHQKELMSKDEPQKESRRSRSRRTRTQSHMEDTVDGSVTGATSILDGPSEATGEETAISAEVASFYDPSRNVSISGVQTKQRPSQQAVKPFTLVLREKGAFLSVHPARGFLAPFSTERVTVTFRCKLKHKSFLPLVLEAGQLSDPVASFDFLTSLFVKKKPVLQRTVSSTSILSSASRVGVSVAPVKPASKFSNPTELQSLSPNDDITGTSFSKQALHMNAEAFEIDVEAIPCPPPPAIAGHLILPEDIDTLPQAVVNAGNPSAKKPAPKQDSGEVPYVSRYSTMALPPPPLDFLCFGEVRVGSENIRTVYLKNNGLHSVKYSVKFMRKYSTVFFSPNGEGVIGPKPEDELGDRRGVSRSKKVRQGGKDSKDPSEIPSHTLVDIFFLPKEEIVLEKDPLVNIMLFDSSTEELLAQIPILVSARSHFSHFNINPNYNVTFRPLSVGETETRTIEIGNVGVFPFRVCLRSLEDAFNLELRRQVALKALEANSMIRLKTGDSHDPVDKAPKGRVSSRQGSRKRQRAPPKGGKPNETVLEDFGDGSPLEVGSFFIEKTTETIHPGKTTTFDIVFNSCPVTCSSHEYLILDVEGKPPMGSGPIPETLPEVSEAEDIEMFESARTTPTALIDALFKIGIIGNSFLPSIQVRNFNNIFEEQMTVPSLTESDGMVSSNVSRFGLREETLDFGSVLVGSSKVERIQISNVFPVPVETAFKVLDQRGGPVSTIAESKSKPPKKGASKDKGQGELLGSTNSSFIIEPQIATIPPMASIYISLTFSPNAISQKIQATFRCETREQKVDPSMRKDSKARSKTTRDTKSRSGAKGSKAAKKTMVISTGGKELDVENAGQVLEFDMTGAGILPSLWVSSEPLDFGNVSLGSIKQLSLSIKNEGVLPTAANFSIIPIEGNTETMNIPFKIRTQRIELSPGEDSNVNIFFDTSLVPETAPEPKHVPQEKPRSRPGSRASGAKTKTPLKKSDTHETQKPGLPPTMSIGKFALSVQTEGNEYEKRLIPLNASCFRSMISISLPETLPELTQIDKALSEQAPSALFPPPENSLFNIKNTILWNEPLLVSDSVFGYKGERSEFLLKSETYTHYKFCIIPPPGIQVVPQQGHIHGNKSKTIHASLDGSTEIALFHAPMYILLIPVTYLTAGVPVEWDDTMKYIEWKPKTPLTPEEASENSVDDDPLAISPGRKGHEVLVPEPEFNLSNSEEIILLALPVSGSCSNVTITPEELPSGLHPRSISHFSTTSRPPSSSRQRIRDKKDQEALEPISLEDLPPIIKRSHFEIAPQFMDIPFAPTPAYQRRYLNFQLRNQSPLLIRPIMKKFPSNSNFSSEIPAMFVPQLLARAKAIERSFPLVGTFLTTIIPKLSVVENVFYGTDSFAHMSISDVFSAIVENRTVPMSAPSTGKGKPKASASKQAPKIKLPTFGKSMPSASDSFSPLISGDATISFEPRTDGEFETIFSLMFPGSEKPLMPLIYAHGRSHLPICHFDMPHSTYLTSGRRDPQNPGPTWLSQTSVVRVVEIVGRGVGMRATTRITLVNPTRQTYSFFFEEVTIVRETHDDPEGKKIDKIRERRKRNPIQLGTMKGIANAQSETVLAFHYTPDQLSIGRGSEESFFIFHIPQYKVRVPFVVVGSSSEPGLFFDCTTMNFGEMLVGTTASKNFKLVNSEDTSFSFKFADSTIPSYISIQPLEGIVAARSSQQFSCNILLEEETDVSHTISCRIHHRSEPISFNIKASSFVLRHSLIILPPKIEKEVERGGEAPKPPVVLHGHGKATLSFGNVLVASTTSRVIKIVNEGRYPQPLRISLVCNPESTIARQRRRIKEEMSRIERWITFSQTSLTIPQMENNIAGSEDVEITFCPSNAMVFSESLRPAVQVQMEGGSSYLLQLEGSASPPSLELSWSKYDFGSLYSLPSAAPSTAYPRAPLEFFNSDRCDLSVEVTMMGPHLRIIGPTSIVLEPKKSRTIEVEFRPEQTGNFSEDITFVINGLSTVRSVVTARVLPIKIHTPDTRIDMGTVKISGGSELHNAVKRIRALLASGGVDAVLRLKPSMYTQPVDGDSKGDSKTQSVGDRPLPFSFKFVPLYNRNSTPIDVQMEEFCDMTQESLVLEQKPGETAFIAGFVTAEKRSESLITCFNCILRAVLSRRDGSETSFAPDMSMARDSLLSASRDVRIRGDGPLLPQEATIEGNDMVYVLIFFQPKSRVKNMRTTFKISACFRNLIEISAVGTGIGSAVQLDGSSIAFHTAVIGSYVTKSLNLTNIGDISFPFNTRLEIDGVLKKTFIRRRASQVSDKTRAVFAIKTRPSVLTPGSSVAVSVEFRPPQSRPYHGAVILEFPNNPELRPVRILLNGTGVPPPRLSNTVTFECPVRSKEVKKIIIENPSDKSWNIAPTFTHIMSNARGMHAFQTISDAVIPARSKYQLDITFQPLFMRSAPTGVEGEDVDPNLYTSSLFVPLPNGTALTYFLQGNVLPPPPHADLTFEIDARQTLNIVLDVPNWLPETQHFDTEISLLGDDDAPIDIPTVLINSPKSIDLPPSATRVCRVEFLSFVAGEFRGRARFVNKETDEFIFSLFRVQVNSPPLQGKLNLPTVARNAVSGSIVLTNPLAEATEFNITSRSQFVHLSDTDVGLTPHEEKRIQVTYLPLVPTETTEKIPIIATSPQLGELRWECNITAGPPPLEMARKMTVPLGKSQTISVKLKSYAFEGIHGLDSKKPLQYSLSLHKTLEEARASAFEQHHSSARKSARPKSRASKAPASSFALPSATQTVPFCATPFVPQTISVEILFEPAAIGRESCYLVVTNPVAGAYIIPVLGSCSLPSPQGPLMISAARMTPVAFRNTTAHPMVLAYQTDAPSFVLAAQGETVGPKSQASNLAVQYQPRGGGAAQASTRLTVTGQVGDSEVVWVYYLQMERAE
eukprot:gnl/Chilomastix_cuspidata/3192.p1 GENE.gnl/Chilomastix_cuspidata/3192~~gnl/Chilomastix_cuspidata/3192.p1  ORF type:complete len:4327 (-),score=189.65 gnl/Chilomastix_cuspidata/3192:3650-15886(-)